MSIHNWRNDWQAWLLDSAFVPLARIDSELLNAGLEWHIRDKCTFTADLPVSSQFYALINEDADQFLYVQRLDKAQVFALEVVDIKYDPKTGARDHVKLAGRGGNCYFLDSRITQPDPSDAASFNISLNGLADNVIKEFVRLCAAPATCYTEPGGGARGIAGLTVAADTSQSPATITVARHENLWTVLEPIAHDEGVDMLLTPTWHGNTAAVTFEFSTAYPRRGTDKSAGQPLPVVLAPTYQVMSESAWHCNNVPMRSHGYDWTGHAVYANANVTGRFRREVFVQASTQQDIDTALIKLRAEKGHTFTFIESAAYQVGRDLWIGDKISHFDSNLNTPVRSEELTGLKIRIAGDAVGSESIELVFGDDKPTSSSSSGGEPHTKEVAGSPESEGLHDSLFGRNSESNHEQYFYLPGDASSGHFISDARLDMHHGDAASQSEVVLDPTLGVLIKGGKKLHLYADGSEGTTGGVLRIDGATGNLHTRGYIRVKPNEDDSTDVVIELSPTGLVAIANTLRVHSGAYIGSVGALTAQMSFDGGTPNRFYINAGRVKVPAAFSVGGGDYTWPAAAGVGFLYCDASNNLSWSASSAIDHGTLAGLSDNDHPQYFLIAGQTSNAYMHNGAVLRGYSDAGSTVKWALNSSNGNGTFLGTVVVYGPMYLKSDGTSGFLYYGGYTQCIGHLVGNIDNTYSLGVSAQRWSNVYSVLGNFTGNITAGGDIILAAGKKLTTTGTSYHVTPDSTGTAANLAGAVGAVSFVASAGYASGSGYGLVVGSYYCKPDAATSLNIAGNIVLASGKTVDGIKISVHRHKVNPQHHHHVDLAFASASPATISTVAATAIRNSGGTIKYIRTATDNAGTGAAWEYMYMPAHTHTLTGVIPTGTEQAGDQNDSGTTTDSSILIVISPYNP